MKNRPFLDRRRVAVLFGFASSKVRALLKIVLPLCSSSCTLVLDIESLGEGCTAGSSSDAGACAQTRTHPPECTSDEFLAGGACFLHTSCGDDEYEVEPPSETRDRVCQPVTQCQPGEYEQAVPQADEDRKCRACPSATFSDTENAPGCEPWSICEDGYATLQEPSDQNDRICSSCEIGQYELDGECTPLSVCMPGNYMVDAPTATTDRVCAPCPEETFSSEQNALACQAWQECSADRIPSEDPDDAPSSVRDRVCVECDPDGFLQEGACVLLTTCAPDEYETVAPTATEDRECGLCSPDEIVAGQRICAPFGPIRSAWADQWHLNIEDGVPQVSEINVSLPSAQWSLEPIDGYYRIRNRYQRDQYLHIEHGELESGPISRTWASAQWLLIDVTETYGSETQPAHRIQNRGDPEIYLHMEWGPLEAGRTGEGWHSGVWFLPPL